MLEHIPTRGLVVVVIVKQDTIVQEVLVDKTVEQGTIAQVQAEQHVRRDMLVQEG